jgi:hypothetical protein
MSHAGDTSVQPVKKHRKADCLRRELKVHIPAQVAARRLNRALEALQQGDKS